MTDIQRQFKHIHKLILSLIEQNPSVDLKSALGEILPDSYGIASGTITDGEGNQSAYCDCVIYDKPLSNSAYDGNSKQFHIKHVLLTLFMKPVYTEDEFCSILRDIASVKQLVQRKGKSSNKKLPPRPERREKIPRTRLPVAMVYCNQLEIMPENLTACALYLHSLIARQDVHNTPDYIYMLHADLLYRNPLLEPHLPLKETDMGISHIEDLQKPRNCYSCKELFLRQHFFYGRFCVRCGDENYIKRIQSTDLSAYTAVVTGARIKIGYAVALRLLRAGAKVIITSRFPKDAAQRYSQEYDFDDWKDNLHVYGLDMRDVRSVQSFADYIQVKFTHLDILINNAAQTVRRPPAFYKHLLPLETTPLEQLPSAMSAVIADTTEVKVLTTQGSLMTLSHSNGYVHPTQIPLIDGDDVEDEDLFPVNQYDVDGQQIDNREVNSWTMALDEVQIPELLEVYLVNAVAPGILVGQLREHMKNSPNPERFIVNVSAVEGQFSQRKQGIHPHTCMAKAALNMLTHSTAPDYENDGIFVTSVDPGWVSDQMPHTDDTGRSRNQTLIPIDLEDAAARVCDPIFMGLNTGAFVSDVFLKDYQVVEW